MPGAQRGLGQLDRPDVALRDGQTRRSVDILVYRHELHGEPHAANRVDNGSSTVDFSGR